MKPVLKPSNTVLPRSSLTLIRPSLCWWQTTLYCHLSSANSNWNGDSVPLYSFLILNSNMCLCVQYFFLQYEEYQFSLPCVFGFSIVYIHAFKLKAQKIFNNSNLICGFRLKSVLLLKSYPSRIKFVLYKNDHNETEKWHSLITYSFL